LLRLLDCHRLRNHKLCALCMMKIWIAILQRKCFKLVVLAATPLWAKVQIVVMRQSRLLTRFRDPVLLFPSLNQVSCCSRVATLSNCRRVTPWLWMIKSNVFTTGIQMNLSLSWTKVIQVWAIPFSNSNKSQSKSKKSSKHRLHQPNPATRKSNSYLSKQLCKCSNCVKTMKFHHSHCNSTALNYQSTRYSSMISKWLPA
jgi:hypothetical protein